MLDARLIAKTAPFALTENILFWDCYRVTVLGDRLFRLERSKKGAFRDTATQAVWFRNMPKQEFSFAEQGEEMVICTAVCKLILRKSRGQVCVELDGKRILANNRFNLLGTYRTLDNCNGRVYSRRWIKGDIPYTIRLGMGVCGKNGVAVFRDDTLSLGEDGEVKRERADGSDEYIFAFGDDYRGAVCALYRLTGFPPLVPRFALGNWWSRYYAYTDEEYLRTVARFEEHGVPLSVATVDMDWHISDEKEMKKRLVGQGKYHEKYIGKPAVHVGWTGYSWNRKLFPNPTAFLQALKEKGLKVTLNLHPSDGVRFWEENYEKMANAIGRYALKQEVIPFSFTSAPFINAYFKVLHLPLEEQGVDFWWIDWQQPNILWTDEAENAEASRDSVADKGGTDELYDPLWALNHYHYLDNAKGGIPLILSRFAGVGSHRYPLGFSGDTEMSWDTLVFLPYFTATASNIGYTWWSHDIGGHNFGEKKDELYLRHIQYGVFSPINRLHSSCDDTVTKEPWFYGGAGYIAQEFLRFRHRLAPYLYTAAYRTATDGRALVEPLYYEWKLPQAYAYKGEYLFGGDMLVLPIVTPAEKDGYARVNGWIPQGKWVDIFTGDEYEAGKRGREITLFRSQESIPVFMKAGGVLPLAMDGGNGCANPQKLEVWVYSGAGEYTLYEDGKENGGKGVLFTEFQADFCKNKGAGTQSLCIFAHGNGEIIPKNREISVRFKDIPQGKVRLFIDGVEKSVLPWYTDCAGVRFAFETGKKYRVEVEFALRTKLQKLKDRAKRELTLAQAENEKKQRVYSALQKAKSLKAYEKIVDECDLPAVVKHRLKEY